jgi:hypothetical protein
VDASAVEGVDPTVEQSTLLKFAAASNGFGKE